MLRHPASRRPDAGPSHGLWRATRDEALADGQTSRLGAAGHAKLGEDAADVDMHGALADEEPRRDLAVGAPLGDDRQDLLLARAEAIGGGRSAPQRGDDTLLDGTGD